MALRVAVVMASINGACKECPYEKECDEDCNAKHPDDAWCEIWQHEDRHKRGMDEAKCGE